jgi:hypothetical protein
MNRQTLSRLALLVGAVLAVASVGWAKTYHMTSMTTVPGAAGEVNVAKEKNGNIQVDVNVTHLAKPGMLTPSANSYVVWFEQEGSQPQSQGQLKIGDDLKGELKSTTTLNNFRVIITAETDSQTKFPSEQVVLTATVQE